MASLYSWSASNSALESKRRRWPSSKRRSRWLVCLSVSLAAHALLFGTFDDTPAKRDSAQDSLSLVFIAAGTPANSRSDLLHTSTPLTNPTPLKSDPSVPAASPSPAAEPNQQADPRSAPSSAHATAIIRRSKPLPAMARARASGPQPTSSALMPKPAARVKDTRPKDQSSQTVSANGQQMTAARSIHRAIPRIVPASSSARGSPDARRTKQAAPLQAPPRLTPGISNSPPTYPFSARRRGLQGRVVLGVQVDPSGSATAIRIERSSGHTVLDNAARQAVSRWRFSPATVDKLAVAGFLQVPVTFRLDD